MDPNSQEFKKIAEELRARAIAESAGTADLSEQIKNALDPHYWRRLNFGLSIESKESAEPIEIPDVDPAAVERVLRMRASSGYYQFPKIVADSALNRMKNCLEITRGAGWHPAFAFLYDEFWRAFRGPTIVGFLTQALGEKYRQLPFVWGHWVSPNSHGWRPHVDGPSALNKLTLWLALTDATLENGCMYVVRRNEDTEKISDSYLQTTTFQSEELRNLLLNSRALPATAGSYLGWNANVLHWGSVSGSGAPPRVSLSVEFASFHPNPPKYERPFMAAGPDDPLPSFETRLHLIATAISDYERYEIGLLRYQALAKQLLRRTI